MRRSIALLLMFLVPLQYTWAVASLHEHPDEHAAGDVLHIGSHQAAPDTADPESNDGTGQADGDHGHHCHHVPSPIILDSGLRIGVQPPDKPAPASAEAHLSYIPPVVDRPPRSLT